VIDVERVDYVVVPTRDVDLARKFYVELLGLRESTAPDAGYTEFETENVTLEIYSATEDEFRPNPGIALRVPDVEAARAELEGAGVEFVTETVDTGVCHIAFCHDFEGNRIALHRRYAPRG
jgi:predicted enzyme related to lactoylglutathione lyase